MARGGGRCGIDLGKILSLDGSVIALEFASSYSTLKSLCQKKRRRITLSSASRWGVRLIHSEKKSINDKKKKEKSEGARSTSPRFVGPFGTIYVLSKFPRYQHKSALRESRRSVHSRPVRLGSTLRISWGPVGLACKEFAHETTTWGKRHQGLYRILDEKHMEPPPIPSMHCGQTIPLNVARLRD